MTAPITDEELARLEAEIFAAAKFTSTEALDRLCAALPALIAAVREARVREAEAYRQRDVEAAASAESFRVVVGLTNDLKEARGETFALQKRLDEEWMCGAIQGARQTYLGCGCDLTWGQTPGVSWNEGKDDPRVAVRCLDCGVVMCPACARRHFKGHVDEIHAKGRADERADVVRWCRTTLSQNRNAQAFADDIERGAHVTGGKGSGMSDDRCPHGLSRRQRCFSCDDATIAQLRADLAAMTARAEKAEGERDGFERGLRVSQQCLADAHKGSKTMTIADFLRVILESVGDQYECRAVATTTRRPGEDKAIRLSFRK